VGAQITHRWSGAISFAEGLLPLLAEVRPGVVAAGGYRGTGNVVGAIWGRAAAELAVTGAVSETAILS
jgi:glycine/D-amino acid oxidase-like deaminating enzyme